MTAMSQIPKQPRTKAGGQDAPTGGRADATSAQPRTDLPAPPEDVNKALQNAYSSYVRSLNSAQLQAQLDQAKAYLSYLEALQQQVTNSASHPALSYLQQLVQARDTHSVAEAQKRYALASVEQQATAQKAAADASTSYLQQTKEIWERLQSEVARQNQQIANSLKDALLDLDVGPESAPVLSLLYQSIRSMSTAPAGDRSP
jgi:spore germination protein GerM